MPAAKTYFGLYRGIVVKNNDPEQIFRLQLQVPDVYGATPSPWALPCLPFSAQGLHAFTLPPVGTRMWVQFKAVNPNAPVWVGCFWDKPA